MVFAFVADTDYFKDRADQISTIKKKYPAIPNENIWGQGRKRFPSCRDIRYILNQALRPGDIFVIGHLFLISTRRDVILDTLDKFHAAKVQLVILDINYRDMCALDPPKSVHYNLYSNILRVYDRLQQQRLEQKEEDRLKRLYKSINRKEKVPKPKPGHPEKLFEDYDAEIQAAVRFFMTSKGTINERTQKEAVKALQDKGHRMSIATFQRLLKKYEDYLKRTNKNM